MELDRLGKVQWVEAWDLAVKASSAGGADAEVKAAKVEGWDVAWAVAAVLEVACGSRVQRRSGRPTKANRIEARESHVGDSEPTTGHWRPATRLMRMRLAVASGKGGTGKTTVAVNLAVTLARHGETVAYVDCDVEAPNGHLFMKPEVTSENVATRPVPQVDQERCLHCGDCSRFCRFNAIVCLPEQTLVYRELCHSCGGCALVCTVGAITEVAHPIGMVRTGKAGTAHFVSGKLNIGEAASPPVIRAAKEAAMKAGWTIMDAPPGTACPMIETVRGCDYVLLVTEPTPFGLHDLRLALEVTALLNLRCGVVINRAQPDMTETRKVCESARVPILAEIPDALDIAKAYSQGLLAVDAVPGLHPVFDQLLHQLQAEVRSIMQPPLQQSTHN